MWSHTESSSFGVFPLLTFSAFTSFVYLKQQDVGAFPTVVFGFLLAHSPAMGLRDWVHFLQGSSSPTAKMKAGG